MPTIASLGSLLVLSPHLDDAVLSCGRLIAAHPGALVVTVFAGLPPWRQGEAATPWDARCGFSGGHQAMNARRQEDTAALTLLGARTCWLDFLDGQYGGQEDAAALADALRPVLMDSRAATVLFPLGLFHSDHQRLHKAALRLRARAWPESLNGAQDGPPRWLAYEDVPYRAITGQVQNRLAGLAARGLCATPARIAAVETPALDAEPLRDPKPAALRAYASQWMALGGGGHDDALAPERYWVIEPAGGSRATAHG